MAPHRTFANHRLSVVRGMTLIELLIAMLVGLVLVLASMGTYSLVARSFSGVSRANSQVDNARIALQIIASDLQMAGFWGGHMPDFDNLAFTGTPDDAPGSVPDICLAYSTSNWNAAYRRNLIGIPVYSVSQENTPSSCDGLLTSRSADSDVLLVRRVHACAVDASASLGPPCTEEAVSDALYLAVNFCETGDTYVLSTTGFASALRRDCLTAAPQRRYVSNIYYIRSFSSTDGDGIPTLVRSEFGVTANTPTQMAPQPLVEGVDALRVEWGLDLFSESGASVVQDAAVTWSDDTYTVATNRGDGVPDTFNVHCDTQCSAYRMSNAVTATVYLLVRSSEADPNYTDSRTYTLGSATLGPFNDHFHRHVYSTTVRLVNIGARRETK